MQIEIWKNGQLEDISLVDLKIHFNHSAWIHISDPHTQELEKVAEVIGVPPHIMIGKLRSNYPHIDSYSEYVKIFGWYLTLTSTETLFAFQRSPVVILTNRTGIITISSSKTKIRESIAKELHKYTELSILTAVLYVTLICLQQTYEQFTDQLEEQIEKFDEAIPPWPKNFYQEAFTLRKETSQILRLIRHFRLLTEPLAKNQIQIKAQGEEERIFDTIYDRAMGTEETAETALDTIRDLIEVHLDTVSHDMNRAMRLTAMITCMVAIPTVISALLSLNLMDALWSRELWQILLIGITPTLLLTAYFYKKGWLKDI